MKKIFSILLSVLTIMLCYFFLPHITLAARPADEQGNIVKAYIVIPSDSGITSNSIQKYKQNALRGLEEARQFYASKLQGHSFIYSQDVSVLNTERPLSSINLNKVYCLANVASELGVNLPTQGVVNVLFVMGADAYPCGSERGIGGTVWLSGNALAELGDPDYWTQKYALGLLMHEMGHVFGLVGAGWSRGHPCSVETQQECKDIPGLGTSIPYPPASETRYSIVGSGADYLGDPQLESKVGFNNTESSPEIQKLYRSPFINPNGDPAPAPIPVASGGLAHGEITDISPYPATVGDTVGIIGRGFGNEGRIEFYHFPVPKLQILSFKDSEIKILILDMEQDRKTDWKFSIRTSTNAQIFTPKLLSIIPNPTSTLTPSSSTTTPPSPIKVSDNQTTQGIISDISPNLVPVGYEFQIIGSGFGVQAGKIELTNPNFSSAGITMEIKSWTDSDIRILYQQSSYSEVTSWQVSLFTSSGEKITTTIPLFFHASIRSAPTPLLAPGIGGFTPSSPSPTPTLSSIPMPSPSPSALSETPCGSGGICRNGACIVGDSIDPNGVCPPATPVEQIQQVKAEKKVVKLKVDNQEFDSDFTRAVRVRLPGTEGQAGVFSVPITITYNDGSTKSLFYIFNYNPKIATPSPSVSPDMAACRAKGGECQASCFNEQQQVGVCSDPSKSLCCANKVTPSPGASVPTCPGSGVSDGLSNSGWGGPCTPQEEDKEVKCGAPGSCSVAACNFNPDRKTYCWYNSGQCYTKEQAGTRCFGVNPTPAPQSPSSVVTCKTDSESAVGCEVECAIDPTTGKNAKCHIYNRDSNGECSLSCRGAWNCVPDSICPN